MQKRSHFHRRREKFRQSQIYHQTTGGVLNMARRRSQYRINAAIAAVLVVTLFACIMIFSGVRRVVARWHRDPEPVAAIAEVQKPAQAPFSLKNARPVNILLLGSDQRGEDHSYRTDVIVLLSIDPAQGTASAVSFPRDLWVESPTLYGMKINMIQAIGGFDAMAEVFESNFGVRPDHYVLVNFTGFTHLIDSMGGIDVHIRQSLTDSCDLPQAQGGICTVGEGVLPMDGATALWYARSRASTSDYDRLRRAQEVVEAVFVRLMSLDALTNLPKYYDAVSQDVETNMNLGDITPLVPLAVRLFQEPDKIHRYVINEEQATPSISWNGMWILLPDPGAIEALLAEAGVQTTGDH